MAAQTEVQADFRGDVMNAQHIKRRLLLVRTAQIRKRMMERVMSKKCLVCDREAAQGRRGLCQKHSDQFNYKKRKLATEAERDAFDREQVGLGNILEANPGRTSNEPDAFPSVIAS